MDFGSVEKLKESLDEVDLVCDGPVLPVARGSVLLLRGSLLWTPLRVRLDDRLILRRLLVVCRLASRTHFDLRVLFWVVFVGGLGPRIDFLGRLPIPGLVILEDLPVCPDHCRVCSQERLFFYLARFGLEFHVSQQKHSVFDQPGSNEGEGLRNEVGRNVGGDDLPEPFQAGPLFFGLVFPALLNYLFELSWVPDRVVRLLGALPTPFLGSRQHWSSFLAWVSLSR